MLAWLNKTTKRKRDESPDSEDNTEACSTYGGVSVQGGEGAALPELNPGDDHDKSGSGSTAKLDCWTKDQSDYFMSEYPWLLQKEGRLGCRTCGKVSSIACLKEQGVKLSTEWRDCLITPYGRDKATQQRSLRKKIKEHKDSKAHKKADEMSRLADRDAITTHVVAMHKNKAENTSRVFRTAYKIAKHGRPLSDMRVDVILQQLNGLDMGRVLHSNKTCAEIADYIAKEMRKAMVNDIVSNQRKMCVLIDESTTISGKSVLVICLRTAVANADDPDTFFFDLVELDGTTANEITVTLLSFLQKHGFTEEFLRECFVGFVCDGASVMLGRKAGVAAQLCAKFPHLFVWHCLNHRLELAVGDVLKQINGMNNFKIFFDKLYALYHASPKNQRELSSCAQRVELRLLVIGRVLSVRWVASSERTVRAVWENYRALREHFHEAAQDSSRDSKERAKYSGLENVLTSDSFVTNLGIMYDALTELSDLSRMFERRETTLPDAERLISRQIRVFESMMATPGPYTQAVLQAEREKTFHNVPLHANGKIVKINPAQFFRSMADNLSSRMATSSHSQLGTQEECSRIMTDMRVLQPDTWPVGMDIQHGDAEIGRLCEVFRVNKRESIQGFREYKENGASKTPKALMPLLKATHTIAISTSECERAFSSMNDILTAKRNALAIDRVSNLLFVKMNGPPLELFNPEKYVQSWLAHGRRSADDRACEAPHPPKADDPKQFWSLF